MSDVQWHVEAVGTILCLIGIVVLNILSVRRARKRKRDILEREEKAKAEGKITYKEFLERRSSETH